MTAQGGNIISKGKNPSTAKKDQTKSRSKSGREDLDSCSSEFSICSRVQYTGLQSFGQLHSVPAAFLSGHLRVLESLTSNGGRHCTMGFNFSQCLLRGTFMDSYAAIHCLASVSLWIHGAEFHNTHAPKPCGQCWQVLLPTLDATCVLTWQKHFPGQVAIEDQRTLSS